MIGGAGNDTYVVDNAGDVVTETSGFAVPSGWTIKGTADFTGSGVLDVVVTDGAAAKPDLAVETAAARCSR